MLHRQELAEAQVRVTKQALKMAEREIIDFKSAGKDAFTDIDELHPEEKDEKTGKVIKEAFTVKIPAAQQFLAELKKLRLVCDSAKTQFIATLSENIESALLVAKCELWEQFELQFAEEQEIQHNPRLRSSLQANSSAVC